MSECRKINRDGDRSCKLTSAHKCDHQFTSIYCVDCELPTAPISYCYCMGKGDEDELEAKNKELTILRAKIERLSEGIRAIPIHDDDLKSEKIREDALSDHDPSWLEAIKREARAKGVANAIAAILNVMRSAQIKQRGEKAKCTRGWIHLIESSLSRLASEKSIPPTKAGGEL